MKQLVVDSARIAANLDKIKDKARSEIIAVLKANGYGLGLRQLADLLRARGIRRFAVTEPSDAVALRDYGFSDEEILVLRSTACEEDIRLILRACATATIGSYDAAVALNGIAEKEGISCDVHIKIDTGMGRYGFEPGETERIISVFRFMTNLNITGMFTHFPTAFANKKKTLEQYNSFLDTVAKIRAAGFDPGMLHAANTSALFYCNLPPLDAVRVGSAISGRCVAKGDFGLQKTGRLECTVSEVRWLAKGHSVGYGAAYVTNRPTKIAVLPVGYSDGFMMEKMNDTWRFRDCLRTIASAGFRIFRKKYAYVYINGKKCKVLGHVGLNHTVADVTEIECSAGNPAFLDVQPMLVPAGIPRKYL